MNKKIVLGAIAGAGIVGTVTGLVVSSVMRMKQAKDIEEKAFRLSEQCGDLVCQTDGIVASAARIVSLFTGEDDYEDYSFSDCDDDYEDDDNIIGFPEGEE